MSNQYLGEIRMFGGNFAPKFWAFCNGQTLSISQYSALFSLIGTTYGGNGTTTFQLPNLQGRLPVGQGQGPGLTNRVIGEISGTENVVLLSNNLPIHNHALNASTVAVSTANPGNTVLPGTLATGKHFYTVNDGTSPPPVMGNLAATSVSSTGNSLPHDNVMPSLCVSFIIAMNGIFPSRN